MSEWKVTSNFIGGNKVYQVQRVINENEIDHSGNREYLPGFYFNKQEAQVVADKKNKEEK